MDAGVVVVVAEKPSVARDIARVLGANKKGDGVLTGNGYTVTWAVGHLVGLAEPHQMRPEWKKWSRALLPMLPEKWPLSVLRGTSDQFQVVKRLMRAPETRGVVCATDAGREGELIFRLIYEAAGCKKPVKRLWISSLTDEAIRDGFRKLKPSAELDALADAARGRSRADWLVGMNLSRAYGLAMNEPLSVGRVQTPTLALVVERELEIRNFVPEDYFEVLGRFAVQPAASYEGTWFRPGEKDAALSRRLPIDGALASAIVERCKSGTARLTEVKAEERRMSAPRLYDLTELQRHANRLYGMSAQRTLEAAQSLYEQYKLLSYPRTDSRALSTEVAKTLPEVVKAIAPGYAGLLAPGTGERPLSRRFVNDEEVGEHHALIPTAMSPAGKSLPRDEQRIYDLVCRRLLSAWHGDYVWTATTVVTEVTSATAKDLFQSQGQAVVSPGWKVLDVKDSSPSEPKLPSGLTRGQAAEVVEVKAVKKQTRPPPRFTEGTLLTAMETAGRKLDDKELAEAMRGAGLGTPATRANIIETLLARQYLEREGKTLVATARGIRLVEVVDAEVKSPVMTGQWESRLERVAKGEGPLADFMSGIETYVREVVGRVPPTLTPSGAGATGSAAEGSTAPTSEELNALEKTLQLLRERDRQGTSRLGTQVLGEADDTRARFRRLLAGLVAKGWVRLEDDVFEKEGQKIPFQRACLTETGRSASKTAVLDVKLPKLEKSNARFVRRSRGTRTWSKKRRVRSGARV